MKTLPAALAVTGLAYIGLGINHGLSIYDEGIPVLGAARILAGDLPYRDFWVIYPPGPFYLLAGAFKVFGPSLLVSRLVSLAAIFASCLLMYAMSRRLGLPARLALLAASLWTAVVGAIAGATLGAGVLIAIPLGLGSAAAFLRFLLEPRPRWALSSGLALGVAFLFRHDIAACLLMVELIFLAIKSKAGRPWSAVRLSGPVACYLAAVALPAMLGIGALMAAGVPGRDLVDSLVIYPFTGYASARSLPLPALVPDPGPLIAGRMSVAQYAAAVRNALRFYFPCIVFALTLVVLWVRARAADEGGHAPVRPVLFVCLIGVSMLPYAWVRADIPHVVPAWFPALLLFSWLIHQLPTRGAGRLAGLAVAGTWSVVFVWGALGAKVGALAAVLWGPPGLTLDPPRGGHVVVGAEFAPMIAAVRYIQAIAAPDERVFVGNTHHDSLVLNDVMFLFLADRRSGTKYHELVPGIATTAAVQTHIVQELENNRVRYAVLRADPGYVPEPGRGASILDEFIRTRFVRVEAFGSYRVWRRRDDRP